MNQVLQAAGDPAWDIFVPAIPHRSEHAPLLAQVSIVISPDFLRSWFEQLFGTAVTSGTAPMATLEGAQKRHLKVVELFRAALAQNTRSLEESALEYRADVEAFRSVAELAAVPFLHACRRIWGSAQNNEWTETYCGLCGAWPVIAEIRGIERARYLRCGRCGQEWEAHGLCCVYCGMQDHEQLLSLVPQSGTSTQAVECCKACGGYLKSFTTLQGEDALGILLQDLRTVELDIAAVAQGYRRPHGLGYPLYPAVDPTNRRTNGLSTVAHDDPA